MSKNYEEAMPGRIAIGSEGLGTASPDLVQKRALELAKVDGRTDANEADIILARAELQSHADSPTAPEVDDPALENLTAWDEPPAVRGGAVEGIDPLDEANIAEQLVEEGISEADHEQRLSAAEENPPEEL